MLAVPTDLADRGERKRSNARVYCIDDMAARPVSAKTISFVLLSME